MERELDDLENFVEQTSLYTEHRDRRGAKRGSGKHFHRPGRLRRLFGQAKSVQTKKERAKRDGNE